MQLGNSIFETATRINIPPLAEVIFVSDMFVEDYEGGAELTTQALIETSPFEVFKLHSKDVDLRLLEEGQTKYWIFGNFSNMDLDLIPTVVRNIRYSVIEYDYKYCRYRSPEKHMENEKTPCDCHNHMHGKMVSAFMFGSQSLWWMSEKQQQRYLEMFPFLEEKDNTVLSSVFNNEWFYNIKVLREKYRNEEKTGWIYLDSPSWVKGADNARKWAEKNGIDAEGVWGLPYDQVLNMLSRAEGFICLPNGADTAPRMTIEAKVLGCKLKLNEFVQHADEDWFATDDILAIEQYLFAARSFFWNGIKHDMEYVPTISGYTTTKNCIEQQYPYEASIASLLAFSNEVVVADGGSTDGTWERLEALAADEPRLKVFQHKMDWDHPRFAVFDGALKAIARSYCTMDFCWQNDVDEIVHEDDVEKIKKLVYSFPQGFDLLALPVIEYWGGPEKVRMDINAWKARLSRNKPHITHGIPATHRKIDDDGNMYAAMGTDGCCYIDKETGESLNMGNFVTPDVALAKSYALSGNEEAREQYEKWFNHVVDLYPSVHHFSWFDMVRKMKTYQKYWNAHWQSLFNIEIVDTAETNMMFDVPWFEVTDEMIEERAKEFVSKMGGWVWHEKWDGTETPHIAVNRGLPKYVGEG